MPKGDVHKKKEVVQVKADMSKKREVVLMRNYAEFNVTIEATD